MKRLLLFLPAGVLLPAVAVLAATETAIVMRDRRELFLDDFVIASQQGVESRLGVPQRAGVALAFDRPWEGHFSGAFVTVIKDGGRYLMYYRGNDGAPGGRGEVTAVAESADGIAWTKPALGLFAVRDRMDTNLVMPGANPLRASHNFSVLLDDRPGVPAGERFKAIGGGLGTAAEQKRDGVVRGVYRYTSPDGIHWRRVSDQPLFPDWSLDSQNVLAWIPSRQRYGIFLRTWTESKAGKPAYKGVRLIARSLSPDFVNWDTPELMGTGDAPLEDLYTNATAPYFRAPHLLIALPFRFSPDRQVLAEPEMIALGVAPSMRMGVSDGVIMTSRDGNSYDRKFMESFIRPGLDPHNWAARSNIPALGVVPTGPAEISLYATCGYGTPQNHIERLTLRVDGFASLHAGYRPGSAVTRPLQVAGNRLELNVATSSVGYVRVVVLDAQQRELPGFGEAEAETIGGDSIAREVRWKSGRSVGELAGRPVRLKFILRDADLYSFGVFTR